MEIELYNGKNVVKIKVYKNQENTKAPYKLIILRKNEKGEMLTKQESEWKTESKAINKALEIQKYYKNLMGYKEHKEP